MPATAVLVVVWLAWHELKARVPTITIGFLTADGIEAGTTKVRHNSVEIGTVEKVELSPPTRYYTLDPVQPQVAMIDGQRGPPNLDR